MEQRKGSIGYLTALKKKNGIRTGIAFAIVLAIFVIGILITGTKNNYATVLAVVGVLPAARVAVSFFVLLPHKSCDKEFAERMQETAGDMTTVFDCIVSNEKKPIGTQAVVITDHVICAYTKEQANKDLFEQSVTEFLKADKLHVIVTLYTEEAAFLERVKNLAVNFDAQDQKMTDRMGWNTKTFLNMCL